MIDKSFDFESIVEEIALILRMPPVDLSLVNIGETGPLKTYHISKCCCFQKTKNVNEEKE